MLQEAKIVWGEMIISTILAQKKVTCQWIDPSESVSGRNLYFVQQSSIELSLSLMATMMGSGNHADQNAQVACDAYIGTSIY